MSAWLDRRKLLAVGRLRLNKVKMHITDEDARIVSEMAMSATPWWGRFSVKERNDITATSVRLWRGGHSEEFLARQRARWERRMAVMRVTEARRGRLSRQLRELGCDRRLLYAIGVSRR